MLIGWVTLLLVVAAVLAVVVGVRAFKDTNRRIGTKFAAGRRSDGLQSADMPAQPARRIMRPYQGEQRVERDGAREMRRNEENYRREAKANGTPTGVDTVIKDFPPRNW